MGMRRAALAAAAAWCAPGAEALLARSGAESQTLPGGNVLVTTGYWRLDNSASDNGGLRNGPGGYVKRMHMVMSLNVDLSIFGDEFGVENMQAARSQNFSLLRGAEVKNITDLEPCRSYGPQLRANVSKYTHPLHMHSITLACVWDGKFSLIGKSARKFPGYDWYAWLDIGMHGGPEMSRNMEAWGNKPWPSASRLALLPTDKISASRTSDCSNFKEGVYIPFGHCVAATAYIIPAKIVQEVVELFYEQMFKCLLITRDQDESYPCLSEQVLMTQMEMARPGLFHFIGKGYGTGIMNNLTTEFAEIDGADDLFNWLGAEEGEVTTMLSDTRSAGDIVRDSDSE